MSNTKLPETGQKRSNISLQVQENTEISATKLTRLVLFNPS